MDATSCRRPRPSRGTSRSVTPRAQPISRLFARRRAVWRARERDGRAMRGVAAILLLLLPPPLLREARAIRKHPPSLARTGEDVRTYVRRSYEKSRRMEEWKDGWTDGRKEGRPGGRAAGRSARRRAAPSPDARGSTWRGRVVTTRRGVRAAPPSPGTPGSTRGRTIRPPRGPCRPRGRGLTAARTRRSRHENSA